MQSKTIVCTLLTTAMCIDSTPLPIRNTLLSWFSFDKKQPQNTCPFQIHHPSLSLKRIRPLLSNIQWKKKKEKEWIFVTDISPVFH